MRPSVATLIALALSTAVGCQPEHPAQQAHPGAEVRAALTTLSRARIFFGHQSVGRDILRGVESLSVEYHVPVRVVAIDDRPPDRAPGLFNTNIGSNGDPASKCEAFNAILDQSVEPYYDVAVLKFCYVDLDDESNVATAGELFDEYVAALKRVQMRHPQLRLVIATIPLHADPPGWRTALKRLLGRATWTDSANLRRNQFNDAVRAAFANRPLFDVARLESTRADGSANGFETEGRHVETLAAEYTTDGGHLNTAGQRRLATGFVLAVANAQR